MKITTRLAVVIGSVIVFVLALTPPTRAEIQPPAVVLILNSYHPGFVWSDEEEAGVIGQLRATFPSVDLPVEYLDAKRYPGERNLIRMKDLLVDKYQGKKVDLIIALDDPAVDMLTKFHAELFPDTPVVFAGITSLSPYADRGRKKISGVFETQDLRHTIDIALKLHPKTTQILAISDMSISGRAAHRALKALQPLYAGRVTLRFLPPCSFQEAQDAVAALGPTSIVLLNTYTIDSQGDTLTTRDSTRLIVSAAKVPVYGIHHNRLGSGIVGGYLLCGSRQGKKAAELGVHLLAGNSPDHFTKSNFSTSGAFFDYEQMKRFDILPSELPENSVVINLPKSVFVTHRKFALTVVSVLALLVVAVVLLAFFIVSLIQARAALRKKTEELDRIFNLSLDMLCITDQEGRFIRLNPAWKTTLGYPLDELQGKRFVDLIHPDDLFVTQGILERLKGENVIDFTSRYSCRDGSYRWMEWRSKPDNESLIYAVVRDVTERKQIEQSLQKSESFLRALLQSVPDLIWLKDVHGVFLACNATFERLYGAKETEIIGKTDYDFVDTALADFFREHDRRAIDAGKPVSNEESVTFADNGSQVLLETIKTPMFNEQGELIGVLGVARDITERKNAEEEKVKLKSQLQQAQKMESVGRLAGGVAHDFNNMLSVILGYGELALQQAPPGQKLYTALQQIMQAAQHSAEITRQLLAFARKQTIAPQVLDMNRAVEGMLKMLQRLIGEDIELEWQPGKDVWPVLIDPGQIDQVLANLCVNARDAIADVGKVTIETGNASFDEAESTTQYGFQAGEYVSLSISDTGSGMDTEIQEHIFEPFFTTKVSGSGTGLGLATVYGIVRQNNGFIDVSSIPGQGTTFTLHFPRNQTSGLQMEPFKKRPAPCGHESILLVEDEPMILDMVALMLENLGYTVISARTPEEAIERAREHTGDLDLLLTDVVMPDMNGRDLAKEIESVYANLKVLFMSGYTANVIAHHGVLDNGVHFMQKPFSKEMLGSKVREALAGPKD